MVWIPKKCWKGKKKSTFYFINFLFPVYIIFNLRDFFLKQFNWHGIIELTWNSLIGPPNTCNKDINCNLVFLII